MEGLSCRADFRFPNHRTSTYDVRYPSTLTPRHRRRSAPASQAIVNDLILPSNSPFLDPPTLHYSQRWTPFTISRLMTDTWELVERRGSKDSLKTDFRLTGEDILQSMDILLLITSGFVVRLLWTEAENESSSLPQR